MHVSGCSQPYPRAGPPTLALAMLALRRFSSVATPTSECSTSCTRCCDWPSWGAAVRCSGDVGAASSMGEARAPSFVGVDAPLKSGLKLSVLSMGGIVVRAAIAGADVMVDPQVPSAISPSLDVGIASAGGDACMLHGQLPTSSLPTAQVLQLISHCNRASAFTGHRNSPCSLPVPGRVPVDARHVCRLAR